MLMEYVQRCKIEDDEIVYGDRRNFSKNAQGLCGIGFNIHNAGNHSSIHKRFNIIYDKTPDMWYLAYSKYCDSGLNKMPHKDHNGYVLNLEKPYHQN